MRQVGVAGCVLLAVAGSAAAQNGTVNFRIREITGQGSITAADPILDLVVEAQVTGAANRGLGEWSFNIVMPGEADSRGTLARLRINNADGSWYIGSPTTSTASGSVAGVANQYRYLVNQNTTNNGVINTSVGTFVNNPNRQELALIAGAARGPTLLPTGIIVDDGTGNFFPASGQAYTNALNGFFGGNGNYVQLYRFRYTVTDLAFRDVIFQLEAATASTFSTLVSVGSDWAAASAPASVTAASLVYPAPTPGSGAGLLIGVAFTARRRRHGG